MVMDEIVIKLIETLTANKADLAVVQPAPRDFSAAGLHRSYDIPYHPVP
jgi:hypothetical protein